MNDKTNGEGVLHCGGFFPRRGWGYGGGRPKAPVHAVLRPVHGRITVFSLPHACLAAGLFGKIPSNQRVNRVVLQEMAEKKWGGSVDRFFADAAESGVNRDIADERAAGLSGTIIGWTGGETARARLSPTLFGVCPDLALTVAVLARRVADLFISWRPGDYGWNVLFGPAFEMDEDVCEAPSLSCTPWSRYKWEVSAL